MLDQTFSHKNFRILLDVENRKGNYLEDKNFFETDLLKDSREITEEIIKINKSINEEYQKLKLISDNDKDFTLFNELKTKKEELKCEREIRRADSLIKISEVTNNEDYKIELKKGIQKFGSQLYIVENTPEHFFVLKQLQRNIYKTFKVKQTDRKVIISQIINLIEDDFPKVLLRTDISQFYESIPHSKLLAKIEENSLLSYPSKKIIRDILNQYWNILLVDGVKAATDIRVGVPRGIGISAYLSELYMRDLDRKLSSLPNVIYYARYVDDILLIFSPTNRKDIMSSRQYKSEVRNIISESELSINPDKTTLIDLRPRKKERKTSKKYDFTYLGYKFTIGYKKDSGAIIKEKLLISMSDEKLERYKRKILAAFEDYKVQQTKYLGKESGVNKILLRRISFLTHNYRLVRRKSNVLVGIFHANSFLTNNANLHELDRYLKNQIDDITNLTNTKLIKKLKKNSFLKGFREKKFLTFQYKAFQNSRILNIWKNI